MGKVYLYVVDRDFGFAPNPFHGFCSLATCKPGIRNHASLGDWVFGMGGARLNAVGKCIFAMRVSEAVAFDAYWKETRFRIKRPVRNGSRRMLVGDNVYHRDPENYSWQQADSHHSNHDGTVNMHNLEVDTKANRVLISHHFYYFGKSAPSVPNEILFELGYQNGRNYRVFDESSAKPLIKWLDQSFASDLNCVLNDPFDFDQSEKRYSVKTNSVS